MKSTVCLIPMRTKNFINLINFSYIFLIFSSIKSHSFIEIRTKNSIISRSVTNKSSITKWLIFSYIIKSHLFFFKFSNLFITKLSSIYYSMGIISFMVFSKTFKNLSSFTFFFKIFKCYIKSFLNLLINYIFSICFNPLFSLNIIIMF